MSVLCPAAAAGHLHVYPNRGHTRRIRAPEWGDAHGLVGRGRRSCAGGCAAGRRRFGLEAVRLSSGSRKACEHCMFARR